METIATRSTSCGEVEPQVNDTPTLREESSEHLRIANFFSIEKPSKQESERLKDIYEWAKDESEAQMFNKLVTKRNELGAPRLGESRLLQFYTWLRLSKDYELAKDNLTKYEVGNENIHV